jgi:hypothetical protein
MPPGRLDMKKPGRKKVAGIPNSRIYFSTAALESKCFTSVRAPLDNSVTFNRELQIRC